MVEFNVSEKGYFDYNPLHARFNSITSSTYSSTVASDGESQREKTNYGRSDRLSNDYNCDDEARDRFVTERLQRPSLMNRLKSAQSITQRHGGLIRQDSMFGKQSMANVRLEDASAKRQTPLTIWIIILTSAMTYTLHGFANSVTNGIITDDTFRHQFPQTDDQNTTGALKTHNSSIQGVAVGLYQVGCALGAMVCYFLNDRFGRKVTIHMLGIFSCIGIVLQVSSFSLAQLIIGRVVLGLGVGAGHATFPLYIAECVSPRIRGRAIIACAIAGNFGHFIGAVVEIAFYFVHHSTQWRVPIGIELIWGVFSAVLPFWCPESPRLLLSKGYYESCMISQAKLSGLPKDHPEILEEVNALQGALREAHADKNQPYAKPPALRFYRTILAIFIQIMSSMSGIDVISFFSTQTFQDQLHFSPLISRVLTMGLQACQWLFSTLAIFAIDTLGRRRLVLGCACVMAMSMGALFGLTTGSPSGSMLNVAILFYFLTMCAYPVGFHLIPSMYVAELSPGAMRHQISAFTGCLHFLCDFLVTLITPIAFESIHAKYYIVYLATNAFTFVVVFLCYPETKGLELETIDEIFELAPSYLKIVPYAKERAELAKQLALDLEEAEGKGSFCLRQ